MREAEDYDPVSVEDKDADEFPIRIEAGRYNKFLQFLLIVSLVSTSITTALTAFAKVQEACTVKNIFFSTVYNSHRSLFFRLNLYLFLTSSILTSVFWFVAGLLYLKEVGDNRKVCLPPSWTAGFVFTVISWFFWTGVSLLCVLSLPSVDQVIYNITSTEQLPSVD
eukprot:TRINITY_DN961_c0_g1_i1.p1 TRINITY_DN961_c0_g1~~TRINITY_DN961_c0_g1_i1.p1  ORF type:complete len:177 (-),score=35.99 TRINITY_DN961_c0_g1_i1:184-681(-)